MLHEEEKEIEHDSDGEIEMKIEEGEINTTKIDIKAVQ